MKEKMEVLFFNSGATAVFNKERREQVPELQRSWLLLFTEFLEDKGIDPTEVSYILSQGQRVEVFKTPADGYNWRLK